MTQSYALPPPKRLPPEGAAGTGFPAGKVCIAAADPTIGEANETTSRVLAPRPGGFARLGRRSTAMKRPPRRAGSTATIATPVTSERKPP